jgi:hypothetical protein
MGEIEALTLLQMQTRWIGSRISHVNIQNQQLVQRINLHLALGGSFEEQLPLIVSAVWIIAASTWLPLLADCCHWRLLKFAESYSCLSTESGYRICQFLNIVYNCFRPEADLITNPNACHIWHCVTEQLSLNITTATNKVAFVFIQ